MKNNQFLWLGAGIVIGAFLMTSSQSQETMTVGNVTSTSLVFTPVTLVGGPAVFWGDQFAAITNADGSFTFPGAVLAAFFGGPGVPHHLDIASINNPQGGTNLYTLTFTAQ